MIQNRRHVCLSASAFDSASSQKWANQAEKSHGYMSVTADHTVPLWRGGGGDPPCEA